MELLRPDKGAKADALRAGEEVDLTASGEQDLTETLVESEVPRLPWMPPPRRNVQFKSMKLLDMQFTEAGVCIVLRLKARRHPIIIVKENKARSRRSVSITAPWEGI